MAAREPAAGASGGRTSSVPRIDMRATSVGQLTLAHHVDGGRRPLMQPTRLMNAVTYIGRLPQNDVVLASENVSRRHAKLIIGDQGVTIHDLDSHNGVFLNGKKVRSTSVTIGDLIYIGDVCLELRRAGDTDSTAQHVIRQVAAHDDITGEEEPAQRNLAAMVRASELIASADDATLPTAVIEVCRELTEANLAALVEKSDDAPTGFRLVAVLQPENRQGGDAPLHWGAVRRAIGDGLAQFSSDLKRHPIAAAAGEKPDVVTGALMCAPIVGRGGAVDSAIYLARPQASPVFTETELETVAAIAQLFALRQGPQETRDAVSLDDDAALVTAHAKVEAAEQKLFAAQEDARALTERLHALEGDNLKIKQQLELEKQSAVDAKREADRGRAEAQKLEQGLHKTDEEGKKLKDAMHRLEEERNRVRETARSLDDERKKALGEAERLRDALQKAEHDREQLKADLDAQRRRIAELSEEHRQAVADGQRLAGDIERASADREMSSVAYEAFRTALRAVALPSVVEHVEHVANGAPANTDAAPRMIAALTISLVGVDLWSKDAPPSEIKARLDALCSAVVLRARANGGRVERVYGATHVITFSADAAGVRAALLCGLEVASIVAPHSGAGLGVGCGLHVGASSVGFFGEHDAVIEIDVGEAGAVSRELARMAAAPLSTLPMPAGPTFYATEAVRSVAGADPAFVLALIGPAALVGAAGHVVIYQVTQQRSGGGGA